MKKIFLTSILTFPLLAFGQPENTIWTIQCKGYEFKVATYKEPRIQYSFMPGDQIMRSITGRVTKVGNITIGYDYSGRVNSVGKLRIKRGPSGRVNQIGGMSLKYNMRMQVTGSSGNIGGC